MKKLVISSALMAASGFAAAQSSVTIFGIIDATLQRGVGETTTRNQLGSGGNGTSRIGFRGTEDLGGGLKAGFWLEGAISVDNGSGGVTNTNNQTSGTGTAPASGQGLTWGRRSTVSLMGNWGEVRLGRDFSVQYYNRFQFDPFANNGVGGSQTNAGSLGGPVSQRVSNAIMYFTPTLAGFYGQAQWYLGENAPGSGPTFRDGTGGGVRLGYRIGPVNVAVAHARTDYHRTTTAGDIKATNIAASVDFGIVTAMGGYYRDEVNTTAGLTGSGFQIGSIVRVGPGDIKAQYSDYKTTATTRPQTKKISLGYVHNLSKRTAVYGTYGRVSNSGGATTSLNGSTTGANQSSYGIDLGLRHSF